MTSDLFVFLNGNWKPTNRNELFELAAKGEIEPSTPIRFQGRESVARKVKNIVFNSKVPGDDDINLSQTKPTDVPTGSSAVPRFCPNCGVPIAQHDPSRPPRFCNSCGEKLIVRSNGVSLVKNNTRVPESSPKPKYGMPEDPKQLIAKLRQDCHDINLVYHAMLSLYHRLNSLYDIVNSFLSSLEGTNSDDIIETTRNALNSVAEAINIEEPSLGIPFIGDSYYYDQNGNILQGDIIDENGILRWKYSYYDLNDPNVTARLAEYFMAEFIIEESHNYYTFIIDYVKHNIKLLNESFPVWRQYISHPILDNPERYAEMFQNRADLVFQNQLTYLQNFVTSYALLRTHFHGWYQACQTQYYDMALEAYKEDYRVCFSSLIGVVGEYIQQLETNMGLIITQMCDEITNVENTITDGVEKYAQEGHSISSIYQALHFPSQDNKNDEETQLFIDMIIDSLVQNGLNLSSEANIREMFGR